MIHGAYPVFVRNDPTAVSRFEQPSEQSQSVFDPSLAHQPPRPAENFEAMDRNAQAGQHGRDPVARPLVAAGLATGSGGILA